MVDINILNGKAESVGKAGPKVFAIRSQIEGRISFLKDGAVRFEPSAHNLNVWKSAYPSAVVKDIDAEMKEFESFVADNRPEFKFKRDQLWWQAKGTEKQKKILSTPSMFNCFAFFFDPGAGKSKSLTDFATMLYCNGEIDAMIVLPPNVLVGDQWTNDSGALFRDIHESIPYKSWLWKKSKAGDREYEKLKNEDAFQIVVMNIDAAKTPSGYARLQDFITRHKGRVLFAIDEAHLIGNTASGRHKKCVELGYKCDWRAVLTGTPITKDLMSAYAIFKFLDWRILGYKYATTFRSNFCITRWNGFADQIVGHKNIEKFYELIEPYTARVSQSEMGLEKMYDEFVFEMTDEQRIHFDRFKREWVTALDSGEFATASIALAATLKMQQISCGYLVGEDGTIQHLDNGRLKALDAWLETIDADQKIVIWCRFREDARLLMKHFGDKAVDLSGNVDDAERIANKNAFLNNPEITRCVGTPDAAGTGMDDLQHVTNRAVYYSSSENYVLRKQSEDRILRVGGKSTAFITDLVCKGSPDKKILGNLKGKREFSKMTLDEVRALFEDD